MEEEFYDIPQQGFKREEKIVVHLKPVANAPILKQTRFRIGGDQKFSSIVNFVKGQLRLQNNIFVYCNSAFSPSPEMVIGDLYESFHIGDELIINYAVTEAWG